MGEENDHRPGWGRHCAGCCLLPQRVVCSLMGFFGLFCAFTNRISLSHVITVLAVPQNRTATNETVKDPKYDVCPKEEVADTTKVHEGIYEWSEQLQGFILGSFYIGYLLSHLPGGVLADKYGAKWVLGLCIFVSGLCTFGSPAAIEFGGAYALIALRIIMGIAQGPIFPALTVLLAAWVPPKERGSLGSLTYSGSIVGTIISNSCSGLLLFNFPWPVTFIVFGGLSIIWFVVFTLLCTSGPYTHPCIKPKEVDYLLGTVGKLNREKPPIPWVKMIFSKPFFSLTMGQIGHDWGYFVMITCLPKYMSDVLQFSIRSNGLYTSLPYILMWISTILSGQVADWLIRTGKMSLIAERKWATFISAFLPGLFMVIASYAGCNKILVVILFAICMGCMGPYYSGQKLTPIDMSPSYAGTIMAIINGLGSIMGLLAPSTIGLLTPHASLGEWRVVFWMGFIILTLSGILFAIWATGEIQSYDPMYSGDQKEEKSK